MTTATIYPQADPWTVDDLDRLPDGLHYEILDGSLLVSPPPLPHHQIVASRLLRLLEDAAPPDLEVLSPSGIDVAVSYLEPDLAVVRSAAALANPKRLSAADALLVVEIISPSNASVDRREKPFRYAEAGIPHFWRVEIQGDRSPYVVRYGLDGDRYAELGTVWAGDEETVDVSFPVTLRPAELLGPRQR
ncbi:MAG TPA: Uma2 family endonuclease [Mycobacteriales bacterium]